MNGRHISDYHQGKVPNQKIIHSELERRGYESSRGRIISTDSLGVPVTIMYLLLIDNVTKIKEFQSQLTDELDKNRVAVESSCLNLYTDTKEPTKQISNWERQESKAIDKQANASGSMAIGQSIWYTPYQNEFDSNTPLFDIYKPKSEEVEIGRDYIRVTKPVREENRQYLIHVFKEIVNFFEMSYALKERTKSEKKQFSKLFGETSFPEIPQQFNSVCNLRGSIIHDSSVSFDFSPTNELKLGKHNIVNYAEKSLQSVEKWLNDVYGAMIDQLNKIQE